MINHFDIIKELDFVRLAGSDGEKQAKKIISSYCKELGFEPKIEAFDLVSFDPGKASIKTETQNFNAIPFGLNDSMEIEGELIFLDNKDVIEYNKNAYKDKIILSMGCGKGFGTKLKKSGIKAYIAIGGPEKEAVSLSHRQKLHTDGYIPMVTISYDDGVELAKKSGTTISLSIIQEVLIKSAQNIIVDVHAKNKKDDNLTLAVGHYDTVSRSHGATDNAGGTVALIKLLEYFSKNPPVRDLRVIFFSGEELGLLGSQNYIKNHLEEMKDRVGLVLNLDVTGDPIG